MKSTLKNMVSVLFAITLAASACVGAVNMITEEPIAAAKAKAVEDALREVLPEFDSTHVSVSEMDGLQIKTYTADAGSQRVGYAVETVTKEGFGGIVRLMVGFDTEGRILNINVLEQSETPGLGSKMCDEGNPLIKSFQNKKPAEMTLKVRKDGGDVDALTAATISSRAYTDAVARAVKAFLLANGGGGAAEEEAAETAADTAVEETETPVATDAGVSQQCKEGGNDGE